jgi:hypothetical protein
MVTENNTAVPQALRTWFIIHFIVDLIFAVPLMLAPGWMLSLVGWQTIDPFTARLSAAALFGIGIASFLVRGAKIETYQSMLNLKIIWSSSAVFGIALSLIQGAQGSPWFAWGVLLIFAAFNGLWVFWRTRLV